MPIPTATPTPTPESPRDAVLRVAASQVGVREATGRNDGEVVKYLAFVGLHKGDPYCGAFVSWVGYTALGEASPYPRSGWSPDFVANGLRVGPGLQALPADTFGIYFPSKGRVAHTGLIEIWGESTVTTIEGNTSGSAESGSAADRDGEGVYRKKRVKASLYKVKSWL